MEKKTIGSFLAALRKANGMTQKDLADRLNVSDKTVSRWERDENAPDLTLIPIIADIFGITSDELLRGERRKPDTEAPTDNTTESAASDGTISAKSQKQLRYLIRENENRLQIRNMIAIGIAAIGVLSAMICNIAFLRGQLGFLVGSIFVTAAILFEVVASFSARTALQEVGMLEEEVALSTHRIWKKTAGTYQVIAVLWALLLPLILCIEDAYIGLSPDSWIAYGLFCALIAGIVGVPLRWIAESVAIHSNRFHLSESDSLHQKQIFRLRRRTIGVCAVVWAVTLLAQTILVTSKNPCDFVPGTSYDNYEDFKKDIETYAWDSSSYNSYSILDIVNQAESITALPENPTAEIEESVEPDTLVAKDGTVLLSYVWRNETIRMIDFGPEENHYLPITVYSSLSLQKGKAIQQFLQMLFVALYLMEFVICSVVYCKKLRKI